MCDHGDHKVVVLPQTFAADACLADELVLLAGHGIISYNSCCGHGKGPGYINIIPSSAAVAEALGYEVRVKDDDQGGALFLIPRGTDWGRYSGFRPAWPKGVMRDVEVPDA